jgi:hypothetical protein
MAVSLVLTDRPGAREAGEVGRLGWGGAHQGSDLLCSPH